MVEGDSFHMGEVAAAGEAEASTSLPAAAPPRKKRKPMRTRPDMTPEDRIALIHMAARGTELEIMAAEFDLRPVWLKRYLMSRDVRNWIAKVKARHARLEIEHADGMLKFLPDARNAFDRAFKSESARLGFDAAKYLHDALVQKPVQRTEVKLEGRIEHDLAGVMKKVGESLAALREAQGDRQPLARVRMGVEALRRPALAMKNEDSA